MSEWIQTHIPCPSCGSSDAASINDRGWLRCFSCSANLKIEEGGIPQSRGKQVAKDKSLLPLGEYRALTKRKITEETCRKFGYHIANFKEQPVQVANYYSETGELIAQKVRFQNKEFLTKGDFKNAGLFGQHLWGNEGKKLVITEGEIDCLTVSQLQGNKWPVVSIPNGAQGAVAAIKKQLEWVMGFEEVVLMFDMDDVGREAAKAVAELLPTGRAKIATLPLKDPNEMLLAGRGQDVIQAIWNAKEYRPDGIVDIDEILSDIEKPIEWGLPWCFPTLTQLTYGRRWGELYAIGAGTGIGKTDFLTQQIAMDVMELRKHVGVIFLESKPVDVGKRIAGKIDGQRYHVPDAGWEITQLRETLQKLKGLVTFYDNWGDTDWEVVKTKIRYMAVSKCIRLIYLDHLTAMADTSNEKESIEQLMKEMAGLANELGIIIHFVSHLSTPEGKPHEEGGRVMIKHFKGSRAIGFWSYFMFGLERNQQAEDETESQTTTFRILKDRYTGQSTGKTITLGYDVTTGRLYEVSHSSGSYGFCDSTKEEDTPPFEGSSDF